MLDGGARGALEARWLDLTRVTLPALAPTRGWQTRADHCFQRVLLDAACQEPWYARIARRPAFRHASDAILTRAVAVGQAVVDGQADLVELNRQSLVGRGHRPQLAATA